MKEQKQTLRFLKQLFFVGVVVFLSNPVAGQVGEASWLNGSDGLNQSPTYGIKGTPAGTNVVGAREDAVSWVDNSGDFFIFGGSAVYSGSGSAGRINDLWRWDGTNWTWLSGGDTTEQAAVYGTKGTAAASNVPGARRGAWGEVDSNGDIWIYGGRGLDAVGTNDEIGDLRKYDVSADQWTWD